MNFCFRSLDSRLYAAQDLQSTVADDASAARLSTLLYYSKQLAD